MVFTHKLLHYYVSVKVDCIKRSECHFTRANSFKLSKFYCNLEVKKIVFTYRAINNWNNLNDRLHARIILMFLFIV